MTMATTLARSLTRKQARFETVRRVRGPASTHPESPTPNTYIPGDRLARTVLLEDARGYVIAVLPSTHRLRLSEICAQSGRALKRVHGDGVREVFRDCAFDALPPIGMLHDTPTWIDDSLLLHGDVYFESGDREEVVHMTTAEFGALLADARHGHFSHRMM
ncbi:aminoacyl-tRNA deacylase [Cupriavidus plantarum]|uniref:aminoacyl-tRNA deacylase n=1 Tax=Cupriavidus plantarum TaxID=942865 RepID=UPI00339D413B